MRLSTVPSELNHAQIAALLPHGKGMCLLDSVDAFDEQGIVCSALVGDKHPLRRDKEISSIIALEYGAQAVGLWAALRHNRQDKPAEGYVLAVRNFKLHRASLPRNKTLTVLVENKLLGDDSAICTFRLSCGEEMLAEGQLTLMMRPTA